MEIDVKYETVYGVIFLSQPYLSKKCGQTCLAMITGKSIELISQELDKEYFTNIYTDLQKYLDDNGFKTLVARGDFEIDEVPNNSIIRFEKPCGGGHYILKTDNVFLDPAIGEVKKYMNEYKITHYLNYKKL